MFLSPSLFFSFSISHSFPISLSFCLFLSLSLSSSQIHTSLILPIPLPLSLSLLISLSFSLTHYQVYERIKYNGQIEKRKDTAFHRQTTYLSHLTHLSFASYSSRPILYPGYWLQLNSKGAPLPLQKNT